MAEHPLNQSAPSRAGEDNEKFRSKLLWFLGFEVVGSGAIAGLTAWILWDRSKLHGWQVGLITFGVFVGGLFLIYGLIFLWNLFRAPYKQRNEARAMVTKLQKSLGEIGYIDALRWEAHEDLQKLRLWRVRNLPIDEHEVKIHHDWFLACSEWIQKNMYNETVNWFHRVDIGLTPPTMDDVIQSYESGFTMLGEIIKTIESTVHKGGSQS
jgi:hypothetical protein